MSVRFETKPIGEVCTFYNGLWTGKKPPYVTAGVFRNTDFGRDGQLKDSEVAVLQVEEKQLVKRRLQFGDIILEKSGGGPKQAVGRVAFYDKTEGVHSFSNFTSAIRVNDTNQLLPQYLLKFLFWTYQSGVTEGMQSHSTGIRNLNADAYKQIEVPIPPLDEQRRIVAVLDNAFAGIATATANAQKNIENAHELFESYLASAFLALNGKCGTKPLSEVSQVMNGYAFKSSDFSPANPAKCIKITNVGVKKFVSTSDGYLPADFIDKFSAFTVQAGMIVMALTRTIIADGVKVAVVPNEYAGALLNQRVASVQANTKMMTQRFLFDYFSTQVVADYVRNRVNTLMQPNLSIVDLKSMPIPVPEIAAQQNLSVVIDAVRQEFKNLARVNETKLTALNELKQSLLQKAFAGG